MLKKNRLGKLVSLVKGSAWLHGSTLQNFARWYFFEVNKVSIASSWEIDIKKGESIWIGLNTKALYKALQKLYEKTLEKVYNSV